MSKHRRLFDLLPEEASPKELHPCFVDESDEVDNWEVFSGFLDDPHAHALIEHAARLHYEGMGYWFTHYKDGLYDTNVPDRTRTPMPLIDALLAAAEHAREGEVGEDSDISMCYHKNCPAREHCKRHPDSGTKPNPHWQSVVLWQPTLKGKVLECDGYWPKEERNGK